MSVRALLPMTLRGFAGMSLMFVGAAGFAEDGGPSTAFDARLAHAADRCATFADLVSCGEALSMKPNDPDLLMAEADALAQLKRPGEAIGVYRNALRQGAPRQSITDKIGQAELQRHVLRDTCEKDSGEAARRACEAAWLPGAADEVALFKRRALLLEAGHQPGAALDAYMAAARLKPRDRGSALSVLKLSESAGRSDAAILVARGAAFLTLHRKSDAIAALRQALRLAPDLNEAKSQLRIAESGPADREPERAENAATRAAAPDVAAVSAMDFGAADFPAAGSREGQPVERYSNAAPVTRTN